MIKINLLPLRAVKKRETALLQIVIFCASLALVLVVIVAMYCVERVHIATAEGDIAAANGKITVLKKEIGKLEKLQSLKTQVKQKLDILSLLRKNKSGPAHRLATLSDATPDQLWLTSYSENNNDVKMAGFALTENLLAEFMRSLEASSDYTGVELVVSEQSEQGVNKLKRFELICRLRTGELSKTPPIAVETHK